jgi:hypothetical protein
MVVSALKPSSRKERTKLLALGSFAGILPDFDYLYYAIRKKGICYDTDFRHHTWITHTFPFYWFPSAVLYVVGFILQRQAIRRTAVVVAAGTTTHLLQDTVGSGDGIMMLFPFTRKMWGVGLLNKHGREWKEAYEKSKISNIEHLLVALGIASFIYDLFFKKPHLE